MGAELPRRRAELAARTAVELGILDVALVAEREAEVQAGFRRVVQGVGGPRVAQPVAAVVGEPQLVRLRMPRETDRVADAARVDAQVAAVRVHAVDGGVDGRRRLVVADVARRAHRHVQPSVGAERDELPAVRAVGREVVVHDHRLGRRLEVRFDVVVAQDAVDLGDVEVAVAERHAVRHVEAARQRQHAVGPLVAVVVEDRVDVAQPAGADEQRPVRSGRHLPRVRHVGRVDLDGEPGRQGQLVELRSALLGRGGRGGENDCEQDRERAGMHGVNLGAPVPAGADNGGCRSANSVAFLFLALPASVSSGTGTAPS